MQPFYIPAIPEGAEYVSRQAFVETYGSDTDRLLNEMQVVDDRWTVEDIQRIYSTPPRPELAAFFEIDDWHHSSGHFDVLCSMSLFGLEGNEARWDEYIDGVEFKVKDFPQKYPSHLFRFYVSPEMWEVIHKRGLMKYRGVDFVKMCHSSRHSRIGTFWRFLGLEDYDYDLSYTDEVECNPWFDTLTLKEIERRVSASNNAHLSAEAYFLREEFAFRENTGLTDISPFVNSDLHGDGIFIENLGAFNRFAGQYLIRSSKRVHRLVPLICHYLDSNDVQLLYHPPTKSWSSFREREPRLSAGQFGFMNEFFLRFLTKAVRINHLFHCYRIELLERIVSRYGRDCILLRLFYQLLDEGHSFNFPGPRMSLPKVNFNKYFLDGDYFNEI